MTGAGRQSRCIRQSRRRFLVVRVPAPARDDRPGLRVCRVRRQSGAAENVLAQRPQGMVGVPRGCRPSARLAVADAGAARGPECQAAPGIILYHPRLVRGGGFPDDRWGVAKLVKALDFDSGIRRFESFFPSHRISTLIRANLLDNPADLPVLLLADGASATRD